MSVPGLSQWGLRKLIDNRIQRPVPELSSDQRPVVDKEVLFLTDLISRSRMTFLPILTLSIAT